GSYGISPLARRARELLQQAARELKSRRQGAQAARKAELQRSFHAVVMRRALDEPDNGLRIDRIAWLEHHASALRSDIEAPHSQLPRREPERGKLQPVLGHRRERSKEVAAFPRLGG